MTKTSLATYVGHQPRRQRTPAPAHGVPDGIDEKVIDEVKQPVGTYVHDARNGTLEFRRQDYPTDVDFDRRGPFKLIAPRTTRAADPCPV
jgi:hypothetical protein